ncbi:MAG: hypothetical protein NZ958_02450 [Bacteroidia bacterium]|nr:hypothetical protein [Bacteroidia bacterium]MDW8089204.1 hypothetical protein [Bacteroidia bacterium]
MPLSTIWSQAWEKFWNKNWSVGVLLTLGLSLLSLIPVVGVILSFILSVVLNYYALQVWRSDAPVEFGQAFPPLISYAKILLGALIIGLIGGGLVLPIFYMRELMSVNLLFVLAGLIIFVGVVTFYFFSYFILEREAGVFEALRGSLTILLQNPGKSILFILTLILVNLLGLLALGVGLLVAQPLGYIGGAGFYLTHRPDSSSPKLA